MSTSTINITLPVNMKKAIDQQVNSGFYSSVSEFIRNAVRLSLVKESEKYYTGRFVPEAEKEILAIYKKSTVKSGKNKIIFSKDMDKYLNSL